MARFSKERWPAQGPVRDLLSYLDTLHRGAGQPSLTEIGRAVALAPSTLSAFFTGTRMINRGNLELVVEYFGGDQALAERLRRAATTAWNEHHEDPREQAVAAVALDTGDGSARLEVMIFDSPTNKLNRPELLLGRADASAAIDELLDARGRVLLHGLGGGGKTALAATVADRRVEEGCGAYLWVRVGGATEDTIVQALVAALGDAAERGTVHRLSGDPRLMELRKLIARSGVTLCVIDDVWQPAALPALVRAMPDTVAVLVTSRFKVGLDHVIEVGGLAPDAAADLLAVHAGNAAGSDRPSIAALCADLGHHSYAVEIAGRHLRQYGASPAELREQIAGEPHRLAMPGRYAADGRESIQRLLDRTYAALADQPDAQRVLAAFGALATGSATSALLARYLGVPAGRVAAGLNALVDISLVKRLPGRPCFQMHDLTFSYARSLAAGGDRGLFVAAVQGFVADLGGDHALVELELPNILAAAAMVAPDDPDAFLAIVEPLATGGYVDGKGHTPKLLTALGDAIGLLRAGGREPGRLHVLLSKAGNAYQDQGDLERAVDAYREALSIAPDTRREVIVRSVLGRVLADMGRHGEAGEQFARAEAVATATGDERGLLKLLEQHSVAAFRQGAFTRVRELAERGVELSRALGDRVIEAFFLNNLGTAEFEVGVRAAIDRHEQARSIAAELGNDNLLALTHRTLGADHHALEQFDTAQQHFREALRLYEKLGQIDRHQKLTGLMRQFGYLSDS